jgi:hypothetical protein
MSSSISMRPISTPGRGGRLARKISTVAGARGESRRGGSLSGVYVTVCPHAPRRSKAKSLFIARRDSTRRAEDSGTEKKRLFRDA